MVFVTLFMSVVHGNSLSCSSAFLENWKYGKNTPSGTAHDSKMQTALILPVIIVIFTGNTVATNLSTVMSTRLMIDTECETFTEYVPTLHKNKDPECSKTESLLVEGR